MIFYVDWVFISGGLMLNLLNFFSVSSLIFLHSSGVGGGIGFNLTDAPSAYLVI